MQRSFALVSVFAAVGCAASPTTQGRFKSELDLTVLLPAGAEPVGVAVSPEGKRYVLDRLSGLYEVTATTANPVFRTSDLEPRGMDFPRISISPMLSHWARSSSR